MMFEFIIGCISILTFLPPFSYALLVSNFATFVKVPRERIVLSQLIQKVEFSASPICRQGFHSMYISRVTSGVPI